MKIKTGDAVEIYAGLNDFLKKDIALPVNFAWNLDDNFEAIEKVVKKFEKHRNGLLKPLNDKGAFESNNGQLKCKAEFADEFFQIMEKVNEFAETENEIEIKMCKREDLPENISAKDLKALRVMIE